VTISTPSGKTAGLTFTVTAPPPMAVIGTFTASPPTIATGQSSTLSWNGITNATACAINNGVGSIGCGNSSTRVSPASSTTYTLTASGPSGSITATTSVTVNTAVAPTIGTFTASPPTIAAGQSSTLSWNGITNATACAIDNGAGSIGCGNSSTRVSPASSTTYTLTATGSAGRATATAAITVTTAPTPPVPTFGWKVSVTTVGNTGPDFCIWTPPVGSGSIGDYNVTWNGSTVSFVPSDWIDWPTYTAKANGLTFTATNPPFESGPQNGDCAHYWQASSISGTFAPDKSSFTATETLTYTHDMGVKTVTFSWAGTRQ